MVRLIMLSFAFLGWAFYEMSGGSEFEPRSARATETQHQGAVMAQKSPNNNTSNLPQAVEVTRVSLNLTSVEDVIKGNARTARSTPAQRIKAAKTEPETTGIVFQSLVQKDETPEIVAGAEIADIREIAGNRVNVRGGPGTDYGVVTKMVRGDQVQILEDSGNGWVRMQSVDGGPVGWVADFLLTEG